MGKMSELHIHMTETPIMIPCPDCLGTGQIDEHVARPHGPNRDVGVIDVYKKTCDSCKGDGQMQRLCDCGEPVTMIMGEDAEICQECADE